MRHIYLRSRRNYIIRFRSFGPADVTNTLTRLGVRDGDVLMVHCGWNRFAGFDGALKDLIAAIHSVVGTNGTVLMPTMAFSGSAIDYALDDPLFDYRRTPSAMGLLSEVYRRDPSVIRSQHPTHSVAGRGPLAEMLLCEHHLADNPCGAGTPWARLIDVRAKIAFLGVTTQTNTFAHCVQALLEPEWAELDAEKRTLLSGLTAERYPIRTRLESGEEFVCHTRLFDRTHMRHANSDRLTEWLDERRLVKRASVKGVPFTVLPAREAFEETKLRARAEQFIVDVQAFEQAMTQTEVKHA